MVLSMFKSRGVEGWFVLGGVSTLQLGGVSWGSWDLGVSGVQGDQGCAPHGRGGGRGGGWVEGVGFVGFAVCAFLGGVAVLVVVRNLRL